jgi:hypothetical protein
MCTCSVFFTACHAAHAPLTLVLWSYCLIP